MGSFHEHFHNIEAETNEEFGLRVGDEFGPAARSRWRKETTKDDWFPRVRRAMRLLPHTRAHFPQYEREVRAYAEAANIPFLDAWTLSLESEVGTDESDHCTSFVTRDGTLIGHNEDFDIGSDQRLSVLRSRIGELVRMELFYEDTLGGSGVTVNPHWTVFVNSLSHVRNGDGIPKHVIARWMSESDHPTRDIERLSRLPRHAGYSHTFVNGEGRIISLECTPDDHRARQQNAPWIRANHYLEPDLVPFETNDGRTSSNGRLEVARRLVRPNMDTEEVKAVLRNSTEGGTSALCNERTIASIAVDIRDRAAHIWLKREDARGWVEYPLDFLD